MAKTKEDLEAENLALQQNNEMLQNRLDSVGAAKIPTADALKAKKKGVQPTRAESLRQDLIAAINMGPEKIAEFYKQLQAALNKNLDIKEEMSEGRLPNLRYLIAVEYEIRKYTKRGVRKMRTPDGMGTRMKKLNKGYRKGLSDELRKFCKTLLKLMGREKPEWDERIPVPGHERLDIVG
jgi:hypothetical protein